MSYRNSRVYMGGTLRPPEFGLKQTDEGIVKQVVEALKS
jgi:hypothetical protein